VTIRHYALGNVGRVKGPKSSNRLDLDALRALRDEIPDEQAAVQLAEIREGDDNNELALALQVFKGWTAYGRGTREPLLLSPDQPRARAYVRWVPHSAVERWSPQRSVLAVALADEPETIVTCHPAAGANGQGDRPRHAREPLQQSWNRTIAVRNRVKRAHHRAGRNVTELLDANAYSTRTLPLEHGEQVVFHDDTDWGRTWPAVGYDARFRYGGRVDFHIDSHDGHVMHGNYPKERP